MKKFIVMVLREFSEKMLKWYSKEEPLLFLGKGKSEICITFRGIVVLRHVVFPLY